LTEERREGQDHGRCNTIIATNVRYVSYAKMAAVNVTLGCILYSMAYYIRSFTAFFIPIKFKVETQ